MYIHKRRISGKQKMLFYIIDLECMNDLPNEMKNEQRLKNFRRMLTHYIKRREHKGENVQ